VRAGDQIEYAFSVVGDNPIYGGRFAYSFYLGTNEPIDVVSFRIIAPVRTANQNAEHLTCRPP
jgi:hypothetical protein